MAVSEPARAKRYGLFWIVRSSGIRRLWLVVFPALVLNRASSSSSNGGRRERCSPGVLWTAMQTMESTGGRGSTWLLRFCSKRRRGSSDDGAGSTPPRLGFWLPPSSGLPLTSPLRARRLYSPLAISWCNTCSSSSLLAQPLTFFPSLFFLDFPLCSRWLGDQGLAQWCCECECAACEGHWGWGVLLYSKEGARWGECVSWEGETSLDSSFSLLFLSPSMHMAEQVGSWGCGEGKGECGSGQLGQGGGEMVRNVG